MVNPEPRRSDVEDLVARIARRAQEAGAVEDPDDEPEGPRWRGKDLHESLTVQWEQKIPEKYRAADVDDLDPGLRSQVEAWTRTSGPRPNLVLLGPTGCGKTHTAVAAVRADFFACLSIAFYSVPRFLFDLRPGSNVADRTADVAIGANRLILDDVGAERDTDWTNEQLWLVTNERHNSQNPIIATSNLAVDALAERVGERIASRLLGGAVIIEVGGRDRRRQ